MANTTFGDAFMVTEVDARVVATFSTTLQTYIEEYKLCRTVNGVTTEVASAVGYEYNASTVMYELIDPNPVIGQEATYELKHVDNMNQAETVIATATITPTSIDDINAVEAISIYPNPVVNYVNLVSPTTAEPMDLTVINAIGQVVLTKAQLVGKQAISVADLQDGVYLMQLSRNNDSIKTIRLVKTN